MGKSRKTILMRFRENTVNINRWIIKTKIYIFSMYVVGQRKYKEMSANKGRGYKIGHNHRLAEYIEKNIIEEKYSPDAVIGETKETLLP
jgi:IS30 family transposase